MDINTSLPNVLSDGSRTYTYGLGNLSQSTGTATDYFLRDALGSTRQLTDATGQLGLTESYEPFGNPTGSSGTASSIFAYAGQQTDISGMQFLRARYYQPYLNQFIQPDSIVPDPYQPSDWNKYAYVRDNPVNFTDPSGHCSGKPDDPQNPDIQCWVTLGRIQGSFPRLTIDGKDWTKDELSILGDALGGVQHVFNDSSSTFSTAIGHWTVERRHWGLSLWFCGIGCTFSPSRTITFYDGVFKEPSEAKLDIIHEFGHAFDDNADINTPKSLGEFRTKFWPGSFRFFTKAYPFGPCFEGIQGLPASEYAKQNTAEDFAETFAVYVWMQNGWGFSAPFWLTKVTIPDSDRLQYMATLIESYNSAH